MAASSGRAVPRPLSNIRKSSILCSHNASQTKSIMSLHGLVYNRLVLAKRFGVRIFRAIIAAPFLFGARRMLKKEEPRQRVAFSSLSREFRNAYIQTSLHIPEEFLMPQWQAINTKLESVFLPIPPFDFLRHPLIEWTMAGGTNDSVSAAARKYLEQRFSDKTLQMLLHEDPVGSPRLTLSPYSTSGSSIRSLHHLALFSHTTCTNIDSLHTIIEWGGGYGCLAKIFRRLHSGKHAYIIIDTPLFSCLQWLYLSTIIGPEYVQLITDKVDIAVNKINLVPIGQLKKVPEKCDLFISTWALNESAPAAQDYVTQRNWFNAQHLLLAYARNEAVAPTSEIVGTRASHDGAQIIPIKFLPRSFYAFK